MPKSTGIKNRYMRFVGLAIAAVLVGIDQLTKWLVYSNMNEYDSIQLIKLGDTEVLNISYYTNSGAAFSRFEGQTIMLIGVTSVIIAALVILLLIGKIQRTSYIIAASMIIGGGAGNLIDRIFNNGNVVDFIDFRIINFAIFNFADICAVCGAILLFVLVLFFDRKSPDRNADSPPPNADDSTVQDDGND